MAPTNVTLTAAQFSPTGGTAILSNGLVLPIVNCFDENGESSNNIEAIRVIVCGTPSSGFYTLEVGGLSFQTLH